MIIIGELINDSRKVISAATERHMAKILKNTKKA